MLTTSAGHTCQTNRDNDPTEFIYLGLINQNWRSPLNESPAALYSTWMTENLHRHHNYNSTLVLAQVPVGNDLNLCSVSWNTFVSSYWCKICSWQLILSTLPVYSWTSVDRLYRIIAWKQGSFLRWYFIWSAMQKQHSKNVCPSECCL